MNREVCDHSKINNCEECFYESDHDVSPLMAHIQKLEKYINEIKYIIMTVGLADIIVRINDLDHKIKLLDERVNNIDARLNHLESEPKYLTNNIFGLISRLEEHRKYQIEENRKISRRVDGIENIFTNTDKLPTHPFMVSQPESKL